MKCAPTLFTGIPYLVFPFCFFGETQSFPSLFSTSTLSDSTILSKGMATIFKAGASPSLGFSVGTTLPSPPIFLFYFTNISPSLLVGVSVLTVKMPFFSGGFSYQFFGPPFSWLVLNPVRIFVYSFFPTFSSVTNPNPPPPWESPHPSLSLRKGAVFWWTARMGICWYVLLV